MSNLLHNSTANLTQAQLQGQINNQFQSAYGQYAAQSVATLGLTSQAQHNAMAALLGQHQKKFMLNGRLMTFAEFLDEIAPGEDNSLRTFLTLKYQGLE